jgi:hypothetical protein
MNAAELAQSDVGLLIASDPHELLREQHRLIASVECKRTQALAEARDAEKMVDQMMTARMDWKPAARLQDRATDRVRFLTKVKSALEAGYVMMPDMPGEVLAIRTENPRLGDRRWWREGDIKPLPAKHTLPIGEGRYVSPRPTEAVQTNQDPTTKRWITSRRATEIRDPDGLDRKFLKPAVVDRMTGAMARGIFDEIVCVGARPVPGRKVRDRDPIVLGRVLSGKQAAAFLIAWFVDPAEL